MKNKKDKIEQFFDELTKTYCLGYNSTPPSFPNIWQDAINSDKEMKDQYEAMVMGGKSEKTFLVDYLKIAKEAGGKRCSMDKKKFSELTKESKQRLKKFYDLINKEQSLKGGITTIKSISRYNISYNVRNGKITSIAIIDGKGNGKSFCSDGFINDVKNGNFIQTNNRDKLGTFNKLKSSILYNRDNLENDFFMQQIIQTTNINNNAYTKTFDTAEPNYKISYRMLGGEITSIAIIDKNGNGKSFCSDGFVNDVKNGQFIKTNNKDNLIFDRLKDPILWNHTNTEFKDDIFIHKVLQMSGIDKKTYVKIFNTPDKKYQLRVIMDNGDPKGFGIFDDQNNGKIIYEDKIISVVNGEQLPPKKNIFAIKIFRDLHDDFIFDMNKFTKDAGAFSSLLKEIDKIDSKEFQDKSNQLIQNLFNSNVNNQNHINNNNQPNAMENTNSINFIGNANDKKQNKLDDIGPAPAPMFGNAKDKKHNNLDVGEEIKKENVEKKIEKKTKQNKLLKNGINVFATANKDFKISCKVVNGQISSIAVIDQFGNGKSFCSDGYINDVKNNQFKMTNNQDINKTMFKKLSDAILNEVEKLHDPFFIKDVIVACGRNLSTGKRKIVGLNSQYKGKYK